MFLDKLLKLNREGADFTDEDLKDEVVTMTVAVMNDANYALNFIKNSNYVLTSKLSLNFIEKSYGFVFVFLIFFLNVHEFQTVVMDFQSSCANFYLIC